MYGSIDSRGMLPPLYHVATLPTARRSIISRDEKADTELPIKVRARRHTKYSSSAASSRLNLATWPLGNRGSRSSFVMTLKDERNATITLSSGSCSDCTATYSGLPSAAMPIEASFATSSPTGSMPQLFRSTPSLMDFHRRQCSTQSFSYRRCSASNVPLDSPDPTREPLVSLSSMASTICARAGAGTSAVSTAIAKSSCGAIAAALKRHRGQSTSTCCTPA